MTTAIQKGAGARGGRSYRSSLDEHNHGVLERFEQRMARYYLNGTYHREWIKGVNAGWQPSSHGAQIAMCRLIPRHAAVLSRWDALALHSSRMRSCARRLARAVFQLDARRAVLVLQSSWMVLVSLVRIVAWGQGRAGNHPDGAGV